MAEGTEVRNGLVEIVPAHSNEAGRLRELHSDLADKLSNVQAELNAANAALTAERQARVDSARRIAAIEAVLSKHVPNLRGDEHTGWALAQAVREALSS